MKNYTITTVKQAYPNWQVIPSLAIDSYPWYQSGLKQKTQIKLAANEDNLFIHIHAEDKYSVAKQTELNHMLICEDSCVEFFFSPSGILGSAYINLEVNCCGTLHIAYGPDRNYREFISLAQAALIERVSSIKSPVKSAQSDDSSWQIEITLPFSVIEQITQSCVNRDKWFANFYRCGGDTEPQYAVWNPIDVAEPDYHRPEHFAELNFSNKAEIKKP